MEDKKDYAIISLSAADESPAFPKVGVNKSGGWVTFGDKNQFPQEIINANSKSPVNASIIESTVTYICGKGVRDSQANADKYVGVPNTNENWDEVIEKIAKDYKTFGGFYFQVVVNKGGTTVSVFHQDYSTVRIGLIDEKGHPLSFKIANDWTKTSGKYKPVELPVWPGSIAKADKGIAYMYHYWDYAPGLLFYSVPGYYPAIEYVKADGTLGVFYNNSIDNGFTPSTILTFASNPSEEKKAAFEKSARAAFCGGRGANSILTVWGESGDVKTNISAFNASNNADVYNNVEGIVFQKIISAHRLSSPTLAGVAGSGNLSGNAAEIIDAYVLYNYTVVEKMRGKILDHLNKFTKINGTAPLTIEELDVLPKIRETEDKEEPEESAPAALTKKDPLRKLRTFFHKYIRKEPNGKGGYRYIYDEPKGREEKPQPETPKKDYKSIAEEARKKDLRKRSEEERAAVRRVMEEEKHERMMKNPVYKEMYENEQSFYKKYGGGIAPIIGAKPLSTTQKDQTLRNALEKNGIKNYSVNKSKTDFGESNYFSFYNRDGGKIDTMRVSDHGTGHRRMMDETHFDTEVRNGFDNYINFLKKRQ